MNEGHASLVAEAVLEACGIAVSAAAVREDGRTRIACHIEGFTAQEGPRVFIQQWGLKRYLISSEMGSYSVNCVRTMQAAFPEQLLVARALVAQMANIPDFEVQVAPDQSIDGWVVTDRDFGIEVRTKVGADRAEDKQLSDLARRAVAPMIAAFGELIGYETERTQTAKTLVSDPEGEVFRENVLRRERSRRNRLLCLEIHGDRCAACGIDPGSIYQGVPSIIEVHHLEPLHELGGVPRPYDPRTDLVPLCPNCHAAVHKTKPVLTPEQLMTRMKIS